MGVKCGRRKLLLAQKVARTRCSDGRELAEFGETPEGPGVQVWWEAGGEDQSRSESGAGAPSNAQLSSNSTRAKARIWHLDF